MWIESVLSFLAGNYYYYYYYYYYLVTEVDPPFLASCLHSLLSTHPGPQFIVSIFISNLTVWCSLN